ncbi:hypothetical protein LSAT2_009170 [Lamellibrachia satsuma]|nr:hypothetical protein LSAT2_009170 [Lamellibrachia satsuma]
MRMLRKITRHVSLAWVSISARETSCSVFRKRTPSPPSRRAPPRGWCTNVKSSPHSSDTAVVSSSPSQVSVKATTSYSQATSWTATCFSGRYPKQAMFRYDRHWSTEEFLYNYKAALSGSRRAFHGKVEDLTTEATAYGQEEPKAHTRSVIGSKPLDLRVSDLLPHFKITDDVVLCTGRGGVVTVLLPGSTLDNAARSCKQILDSASNADNGVYWICASTNCTDAREVFCDMRSGGWTLIGQINAVDLAVNHANEIRLSSGESDTGMGQFWVEWDLPADRDVATFWRHSVGRNVVDSATMHSVQVQSSFAPKRICYQNKYGMQQLYEVVTRYAPTGEADEEERDTFYDSLQTTLEDDPTHDVLVLLGNYVVVFIAITLIMGRQGTGRTTDNDSMFSAIHTQPPIPGAADDFEISLDQITETEVREAIRTQKKSGKAPRNMNMRPQCPMSDLPEDLG